MSERSDKTGKSAATDGGGGGAVWLRPDGRLAGAGFGEDDGEGLLALVKGGGGGAGEDAARSWLRGLAADHVRRVAAAADGGAWPPEEALRAARPQGVEALGILAGVPPMVGGEYWSAEVLDGVYGRLEAALERAAAASGKGLAGALAGLGAGWRDLGKVSLHLAENKGDASAERPFAFLATYVQRTDGEGRARHLPLSAALKACAGNAPALARIVAPLEAAGKESPFLAGMLESRRIFRPCALTVREAYQFLTDVPRFEAAGLLVRTGRLWAKAPPRAKVRVNVDKAPGGGMNGKALCRFDAEVVLGGEPLSPEELELLAGARDGLVRIRGEWVVADPEHIRALLDRWQAAKRMAADGGIGMAQALRLLAGGQADGLGGAEPDADEEVVAGGDLRELLEGLKSPRMAEAARAELPNGLGRVLRPYQLDGVAYLRRSAEAGLGACLADDMGLGKTLQVLAAVDSWKAQGRLGEWPVMIVMPASLLQTWKNEAARFAPDLRVGVLHPSSAECRTADALARPEPYLRRCDLALTTYGQFMRTEALHSIPYAALIADEAQAIKNPGSRQSRAMRSAAARLRIALTGTPVENRLTDLWSLFDFINPGLLGSLAAFRRATDGGDRIATVRRLTRPFILRRLKTDRRIIADLPDKTELDVPTALSRRQAVLYAKTVEELRAALEEARAAHRGDPAAAGPSAMSRRGLVLAYMTKFKQICDHPALYLGTGEYRPEDSGKFLALGARAEEIAARQEKMLVFTQYREMTEPLAEYLAGVFGREGLVLHGATPVKERARLVERFQDPAGPPFFVLSVKAAGTGLTLTAANHVVHFDRWWNPAVENQASDRAYRIGQRRNVLIHKFVTPGTLEENIDEMIKAKQDLADALFGGDGGNLVTEMDDDELLELVRLGDYLKEET
ncbi:MAG: DEAD/DEAH box helicase [Kiritimatiellae bacterium]|nr:DEAD/DEAH box helicase [Kiritimatiellia bacterium]